MEIEGDLRAVGRWQKLKTSSIVVSPDSRWALATGWPMPGPRLMSLSGSTVLREPPVPITSGTASFAPDGVLAIAAADPSPRVVLWDLEKDVVLGTHIASAVLRHEEDGSFLALLRRSQQTNRVERWTRGAGSTDWSVELRMGRKRLHNPDSLTEPFDDWDDPEEVLVALPGGRLITQKREVTNGQVTALFEWNLHPRTPSSSHPGPRELPPLPVPDSLHALPAGRVLARRWTDDAWLALWDLAGPPNVAKELWHVPLGATDHAMAVDPGGTTIAIASAGGRIELRNAADGKIAAGARITPPDVVVSALAFVPDGRLLLAANDGTVLMLERA